MGARAARRIDPALGRAAVERGTRVSPPAPGQRGQALVEFALGSTVLILLLAAAMDFGSLYSDRLELDNAARVGARWAVQHPTAWTTAASPADNSIAGQIIYAGDTRQIPNDDSSITIAYYSYDPVAQAFTQCGQYYATTSPTGFQAMNG